MSESAGSKAFSKAVRQVALLTRLGYPLAEGLKRMGSQESPWLPELGEALEQGDTLSQALARQPRLFSSKWVSLVKAAESSEAVTDLLVELSKWLERCDQMRKSLRQVMLYPLVVLNFILLEVFLVFSHGLPEAVWPLSLQARDLIQVGGLEGIGMGALVLLVAVDLMVWKGGGDALLMRLLPGGGHLLWLADQALWSRGLGTLLAAGVELPRACELAAASVKHPKLAEELRALPEQLRRGKALSKALSELNLDPYLSWCTVAGENQENLGSIMLRAADHLDHKVEAQAGYRVRVAEPWALFWLGLLVFTVIVIFWYPFYTFAGAIPG